MWKLALKSILVFAFCLLFIWHVRDGVQKYVSGKTVVTTVDKLDPNLTLPTIVVCCKEGFKGDKMKELKLPMDFWLLSNDFGINLTDSRGNRPQYSQYTFQELDDLFKETTYGQEEIIKDATFYDSLRPHKLKVNEVSSSVLGRCYSIINEFPLTTEGKLTVLKLNDPSERGLTIIVQPDNYEALMISGDYVLSPYTQFDLHAGDKVKVAVVKSVEYTDGQDCSRDLPECVLEATQRRVNCSLPQIKPFGAGKPLCKGDLQYKNLPYVIGHVVSDKALCPEACMKESFSVEERVVKRPHYDKIDLLMFFNQFKVKSIKKTKLFDLNAIIASVGGSLGLFLGFSCLGAVFSFVDWLFKKN